MQLHSSYSSLGRDFKSIFEDLTNHLSESRKEVGALRQQLSASVRDSIQSTEKLSVDLQTSLQAEHEQNRQERHTLLIQIGELVNKSGEQQEYRWQDQINKLQAEVSESRSNLQAADEAFNKGLDTWSSKEQQFNDEVTKSRDLIKTRMKEDWKSINEDNASIRTSTESIHKETIRIVDAQMEDIAGQMQALDDFVTRARRQNERHHESHLTSLDRLATGVRQSYTDINVQSKATCGRVKDLGVSTKKQADHLSSSLLSQKEGIRGPLATLLSETASLAFQEYHPTGNTPERRLYEHTQTLPRTEDHKKLLGHPKALSSPTRSPRKSPTKTFIYSDVSPATETSPAPPIKENDISGLREISTNVTASVLTRNHSDSAVLSASMSSGKVIDAHATGAGMALPPLKRQATGAASRLPTKFGGAAVRGTAGGLVRLEGRENLGASFGASTRRLRSSPPDREGGGKVGGS